MTEDRLDKLNEGLSAFGDVTGRSNDPLAEKEEEFDEVGIDPFELYLLNDRFQEITEETFGQWENTFGQWKDFMAAQNRHPACPSDIHVSKFVEYQRDTLGFKEGDVKKKLFHLQAVYRWMQERPTIPIPTDFNPFGPWLKKGKLSSGVGEKNYVRITVDEVRDVVGEIKNIRERAITVSQLKFGCRSGELCNILLSEISIKHDELREHYTEMGTHPEIEHLENVVFIPSDRKGNKREVDTILPLDEETRQIIVDWLLIRPDNGKEEVFFSDKGKQLTPGDIRYMWTQYWWPEYEYDDEEYYDSITPHWSRHFFSTWWENLGVPEVKLKYMRGDATKPSNERQSALDSYIHTYFEDIEDLYRENIFPLRLNPV